MRVSKTQKVANCKALADYLETVPDKNFDMDTWLQVKNSSCGTVGCALGWAALGNIIPGLQWGVKREAYDPKTGSIRVTWAKTLRTANKWLSGKSPSGAHVCDVPIMEGKECDWDDAGATFFGEATCHGIFYNTQLSKAEAIARLRKVTKASVDDLNRFFYV